MPATEQTWRSQRRMHIVFSVSTLIMVLATVWMLGKDHIREWKQYQLDFTQVENWRTRASLLQTEVEADARLAEARLQLATEESQPVDKPVVDQFIAAVMEENERLDEAGQTPADVDLERLEALRLELDKPARLAEEARQARADKRRAQEQAIQARLQAEKAAQRDPQLKGSPQLEAARQAAREAVAAYQQAQQEVEDAEAAASTVRTRLLEALQAVVQEARRREKDKVGRRKFAAADHTAKVSELGIAIDEDKPEEERAAIQQEIDEKKRTMDQLDEEIAAAKDYRLRLENIISNDIRGEELAAQKVVDETTSELERLRDSLQDRLLTRAGDRLVRLPVLDAFNNTELGIEQIWLPDIKINYNFSDVARFDRCITCHRAIDRTAPGSAVEPLYPNVPEDEREQVILLQTQEEEPLYLGEDSEPISDPDELLERTYGIVLAERGQIDPTDVTIEVVFPQSLAAQAGLRMGDVIYEIDGGRILEHQQVYHYLLEHVDWGEPISLVIRRGLPNPFTSHPRLDLYVGSMSPHQSGDMGCTICHDGQGSATAFRWASHTPNTPQEANQWSAEHDWFDNHHWIFPMLPERFLQSNCLKCHHEVMELAPSERYPEPPAPKLVQGWQLIQDYGCYGCHEINGYSGPQKRIGPDLRSEPNFHAVAQELLGDEALTEEEQSWASRLVHHPDDETARRRLHESLKTNAQLAANPQTSADARPLAETTHQLADLLADVETPGTYRRGGPSLRYLAHKLGNDQQGFRWLYSWIRKPSDFRPSSKMPQFFGHFAHLDEEGEEFPITRPDGKTVYVSDRAYTQRYEEIEIRAISEYLLAQSRPWQPLPQAEGVEAASAERGRWEFEKRCLACHQHEAFPGIANSQGPELSNLTAKLDTQTGRAWLYSWLKDPSNYHARTKMPNLFLDPQPEQDASFEPTGRTLDPAADIAAFLLSGPADWEPQDVPSRQLTAEDVAALDDLATEWMLAKFSRRKSRTYLEEGIPAQMAAGLKGDEQLLAVSDEERSRPDFAQLMLEKKVQYIGSRAISKYGCFGCHDIPGFENAKPIGTGLADWGRKDPSRLAFEQVFHYLGTHGLDGQAESGDEPQHHSGHGLDPGDYDPDTGYFVWSLNAHQRQGFLWQKLRAPRSYDYKKTRNKGYNERLRMPLFPFDAQQREAVMTFVLGLTSEAPAEQYHYRPEPRQEAIVQGKIVLEKYNCGGCHVLDMERWQLDFHPDTFAPPPDLVDFPFLAAHFNEDEVAASKLTDHRGLRGATLYGKPLLDTESGEPQRVDLDGIPLEEDDDEFQPHHWFQLWRDALIGGEKYLSGQEVLVPAKRDRYGPQNGTAYPRWGGDLALYLYPRVVAREQQINPEIDATQAWGWLPPPLIEQGRKVNTDWLHDFLLDPHAIRPAAVLRMPKFNMSSDEASKIVNYFAAIDHVDFPYEYGERRRDGYLASMEEKQPSHLEDALKIIVDANYCVKCHGVGDFQPQGNPTALAPDLGDVYHRLRGDYVRRWVANPKRILPYTGMPVNIPYQLQPPHYGGVSQELYAGMSVDQLDAVVDFLMNFDVYTQRQTAVTPLVKAAAEKASAAAGAATGGGE